MKTQLASYHTRNSYHHNFLWQYGVRPWSYDPNIQGERIGYLDKDQTVFQDGPNAEGLAFTLIPSSELRYFNPEIQDFNKTKNEEVRRCKQVLGVGGLHLVLEIGGFRLWSNLENYVREKAYLVLE